MPGRGYGYAVATSDGNGWIECACGQRHWGRFGAAGLLLIAGGDSAAVESGPLPHDAHILVQHRVDWSHEGGTWGIPGGACDSHEDVVTAAIRETQEETGVRVPAKFLGVHRADHGTWSYTTVLMRTREMVAPVINAESTAAAWLPIAAAADLPLHPGLRAAWPALTGRRVSLLVDVANLMGTRPDGWWRDRALGAQRTVDDIAPLVGRAFTADGALVALIRAVVEGDGRATGSPHPAVFVTAAQGSADDAIVSVAGPDDIVVTADAELRERVRGRCAGVLGPAHLWRMVAELA